MPTTRVPMTTMDRLLACAFCERTILLGEAPLRFTHQGQSHTVCPLCVSHARKDGWIKEGRAAPPPITSERHAGRLGRLFTRTRQPVELDPSNPVLAPNGLGIADELARATTMLIGVETFNASPYRGTISGITRSLGRPRVSVVAFGGHRPGAAITIVWDLTWYRYHIEPGGIPTVRLDERGDALAELAPRWREWNAVTREDGAIELDIRPPNRPTASSAP